MKARIKNVGMKDSLEAFKNGASKNVTAETEKAYTAWLEYSHISNEQFLQNCNCRNFTIRYSRVGSVEVCEIGHADGNSYTRIGEPIISSGNPDEREMWRLNVNLLLFLIAAKLDTAFKTHRDFCKGDENYFLHCVKTQWSIED